MIVNCLIIVVQISMEFRHVLTLWNQPLPHPPTRPAQNCLKIAITVRQYSIIVLWSTVVKFVNHDNFAQCNEHYQKQKGISYANDNTILSN
jgi:hypothetical protein